MSRAAPPGDPVARERLLAGAGRGLASGAAGGAAAFLWIVAACQVLTLLGFLLARAGALATWVRGGLALSVLALRAEVTATIPGPPGLREPIGTVEVSLVFVPMLATLAFVWLCGRAGRRAADRRRGGWGWLTVVSAAAGAGAAVAVPAAVAASAARLRVPTLAVDLAGDPASAAVWGSVLAASATGVGAALRLARTSTISRVLRGGLVGYGWALLLLASGVVAIAALEPRATRAYVRVVADAGSIGPAVFGLHALALPAQSALIQGPAAGACLDVLLGSPALTLCPWRLDPGTVGIAFVPRRTQLSPWLWGLSAVPAIAAFLGGRRAALAAAGLRAVGLGAGSGVAFGGLSLVGAWFAAPRADGDLFLLPLALTVDPIPFTAFATAWGVIGGAVGGWAEARLADRGL